MLYFVLLCLVLIIFFLFRSQYAVHTSSSKECTRNQSKQKFHLISTRKISNLLKNILIQNTVHRLKIATTFNVTVRITIGLYNFAKMVAENVHGSYLFIFCSLPRFFVIQDDGMNSILCFLFRGRFSYVMEVEKLEIEVTSGWSISEHGAKKHK